MSSEIRLFVNNQEVDLEQFMQSQTNRLEALGIAAMANRLSQLECPTHHQHAKLDVYTTQEGHLRMQVRKGCCDELNALITEKVENTAGIRPDTSGRKHSQGERNNSPSMDPIQATAAMNHLRDELEAAGLATRSNNGSEWTVTYKLPGKLDLQKVDDGQRLVWIADSGNRIDLTGIPSPAAIELIKI